MDEQTCEATRLEVDGRVLATDPEGYLRDLADWDEPVARAMAPAHGIELVFNNREVIRFQRPEKHE
jgi:tRNA 2-thiouridine synthesizing protein E